MSTTATKMTITKGDATCPQGRGTKIITHIVNDSGKWGKGFVMALSNRWPETRKVYLEWYKSKKKFKLGEICVQLINAIPVQYVVVHMVAQRGVIGNSNPVPLRYDALEKCLKSVADWVDTYSKQTGWLQPFSVHMPKIGCGLAGGKWEKVEPIIQAQLCDRGIPVTVYEYE